MEVQDGFIVSIFNYCDRWCERCPLTARCRVFAMSAEQEFESDHGPLTEPMVERQAKAMSEHVSRWEKELGVDFAEIQREVEKNPEAYERALHHFSFFVPSKIHRALQGLAEDEPLELYSDAYGSAKAALIGLQRMRQAWEQLITGQIVTEKEAAPFVNTTRWLIDEIDRLIPQARAFIRPGLDELDEVRKLEEEERAGNGAL